MRFVRDTTAAPIEGRVLNFVGDTMDIGVGSALVRERVNLRDVARLDVRRRNTDLMAVLGVAGLVTGGGMYLNWCQKNPAACRDLEERARRERECDDDDEDGDELPPLGSAAVAGFFVGSLIGYVLTPPSWQRIEQPVRFGLAPMKNGLILYASIQR